MLESPLFSLFFSVIVLVAGSHEDSRTPQVKWMSESASSASYQPHALPTSHPDDTDVGLGLVTRDVSGRVEGVGLASRSESAGHHLRQDNRGRKSDNRSLTLRNCSKLYDSSYGYNSSGCKFVRENCQSKAHLMNYLAFMECDLPRSAAVC